MSSSRIHFYYLAILCIYLQLSAFAFGSLSEGGDVDDYVFSRYDRDAYFAARYVDAKGSSGGGRESSHVREQIMRNINSSQNKNKQHSYYDDPNANGCATYLAPSSIPNSGLGMYTTTPYQKGESFPYQEIGIMLQEKRHHSPSHTHKLLAQYPWSAQVLTLGGHEVGYGESVVPGLGMLANSHLGLVNMRHTELWKTQPWRDGTESHSHTDTLTMDDPGRGAHSWHGSVSFEAQEDIEAGEELFVSYGEEWFVSREHFLGIVPGESHFKEADELLRSYLDEQIGDGGSNYAYRNEKYEQLLKDASEKDKRLRAALPNNLIDVPRASTSGTARFSAKASIRSVEWLQENGACIDNIVTGISTIPQAGKGAFATRTINKGDRITTTPVITLVREELALWDFMKETEDGGAVQELMGHQLIFNYCYGHEDSSLLFFPYAPSVNFINHGSEDSNAEIRWSTLPYHKAEWLDLTLDEMKDKLKTGLLFDIIATREIRRGEEVLLNYGKDWEESWKTHIEEWGLIEDDVDIDSVRPHLNLTDRLGLPTTVNLNQVEENGIVRTMDEQLRNPYPTHIMTRCQFEPPKECVTRTNGNCQSRWTLTFDALQLHPCTILSRETIEGTDWYTAQVEVPLQESTETILHLVEYMPRLAIRFVDKPYSRDQYAHGVFRQVVGLPDGIMPLHWMDLNGDEMKGNEGGV